MDTTIYSEVVITVVGAVLTGVMAYAMRWIRAHIRTTDLVLATDVARAAVQAVEQISHGHGWMPEAKYADALKYAHRLADVAGVKLTDQQWQALVEKAVHELKNDFSALLNEPLPEPAKTEVTAP